jgi:hypothetical protein
MHLGGRYVDLVCDFDGDYDRRAHLRTCRSALKRWMAFLTSGRDWRVMPHRAWELGSLPVDARFDGNFWFYFESREDMATFRTRYRCSKPQRRVDGEWKRTRRPSSKLDGYTSDKLDGSPQIGRASPQQARAST